MSCDYYLLAATGTRLGASVADSREEIVVWDWWERGPWRLSPGFGQCRKWWCIEPALQGKKPWGSRSSRS